MVQLLICRCCHATAEKNNDFVNMKSCFFIFLDQKITLHFSNQRIYYLIQNTLNGIVCLFFKATKEGRIY